MIWSFSLQDHWICPLLKSMKKTVRKQRLWKTRCSFTDELYNFRLRLYLTIFPIFKLNKLVIKLLYFFCLHSQINCHIGDSTLVTYWHISTIFKKQTPMINKRRNILVKKTICINIFFDKFLII